MLVKFDQRKLTLWDFRAGEEEFPKPFFIKVPTESSELFGLDKIFISTNFHSSRANTPHNYYYLLLA